LKLAITILTVTLLFKHNHIINLIWVQSWWVDLLY